MMFTNACGRKKRRKVEKEKEEKEEREKRKKIRKKESCLLYTSDAADEDSPV